MKLIPKLQKAQLPIVRQDAIQSFVPRERIESIPLTQEQQQNMRMYGQLTRPEQKQTYISQGKKKTPAEQKASDKKLAEQEKIQNYQKQKEKEAKDLQHAVEVAPYLIPGLGQAMWAGKAVDLATNQLSNDKYKSWGDMVDKNTGSGEIVGDLTNPGYYAGTVAKLAKLATPIIKSTGKELLIKSEPYLLGEKQIPMMQGYKPKLSSVINDSNIEYRPNPIVLPSRTFDVSGKMWETNPIYKDNINKGVNWYNDWISHPEYKKRADKLKWTFDEDLKNTESYRESFKHKQDFHRIINTPFDEKSILYNEIVNHPTVVLRTKNNNSIVKFDESLPSNVAGRTVGFGNYIDINPNISVHHMPSTTIHELTHGGHYNAMDDKLFNQYYKPKQKTFNSIEEMLLNSLNPNYANNTNKLDYLRQGTEGYARVMETRFQHGIKPGQKLTSSDALNIYNEGIRGNFDIDPLWFRQFKSPEELKKLFNRLPSATLPIVGTAATGYGVSQKKKGGLIPRNK